MRAPAFTERLLAYHTRFERHLLLLRLHGEDRTEADLPASLAAELRPTVTARGTQRGPRPEKRGDPPPRPGAGAGGGHPA